MPGKGHSGASMGGVESSPARRARQAARRAREEAAAAAKASGVATSYACICARNPGACRATTHQTGPDR